MEKYDEIINLANQLMDKLYNLRKETERIEELEQRVLAWEYIALSVKENNKCTKGELIKYIAEHSEYGRYNK